MFHSSRWDYAYTGGDERGGLVKLRGKRVAVVGSGASAAQVIPHVAEYAERHYVVQRTPSGVDRREEKPTDPQWTASLAPGWQKRMIENFTALTSGAGAEEDLIDDGWTFLFAKIGALGGGASLEELLLAAEQADAKKMNELRERINQTVKDPVIAGVEHEVDALIFASGFEIAADPVLRNGFSIIGRDGLGLKDKWRRQGISTFHGMMTHGFPNFFIHQPAQGALAANFCHGLDENAQHIRYIVGEAEKAGALWLEATAEAEAGWVETCGAVNGIALDFLKTCTPGYYNAEGKIDPEAMKGYGFGLGPVMFFNIFRSWREDGGLEGLALQTRAA